MSNIHATIITIGDELLIGQTIDTNSAWIAQQLNALGIDIARRVAVGDTREAILSALGEETGRNDFLIVTGGLGPTSDDITKPLLCEFFGGKMVVNEEVLHHIQVLFATRKRPFTDQNRKQAEVPDVCTVLFNAAGTAPGMWFEQEGKVTIALPGVPYEMMGIMEAEVLPRLRQRFTGDAIVHRSIITAGEGESFIADKIKDLEEALPAHIKLAYLPSPGMVLLRLTAHGPDEGRLITETEMRRGEIANQLGNIVLALEDLSLEHILGKLLVGKGLTLGLAESCTGGLIAHKLTQIMGSAQYFNGSVVCYQQQVKEDLLHVKQKTIDQYGMVSEEVAVEMAYGAKKELHADIGFGITGLLSPGGEDEVPVGTVCVAAVSKDHSASRIFHFHMDRLINKELAANNAMLFIWRFIQGKL